MKEKYLRYEGEGQVSVPTIGTFAKGDEKAVAPGMAVDFRGTAAFEKGWRVSDKPKKSKKKKGSDPLEVVTGGEGKGKGVSDDGSE